MAEIVQCSNCGKKLKLKAPAAGKKLRCPGCKEPFVPAGKSSGARKKSSHPASDFDDYGADDDFGGDGDDDYGAPSRPRRSAGKQKKGKEGATKKQSKTPLIAGIAIVGIGLAGGLVYMLVSSNTGESTASSDPPAVDAAEADVASPDTDTDSAADTESATASAGVPQATGGVSPAAANSVSPAAANSGVELAWLPPTSEAVVSIDIGRLLGGPLGQLLQNPMVESQIEKFTMQTGFGPGDVQSVTLGVGGISDAVNAGRPPKPEDLPIIAVVRVTTSVELSKLQSAIPGAESVTDGQVTFLRVPQDPPVAVWLADSTTAVIGSEEMVKKSAAFTTPPAGIDAELFAGDSAIQVLFSPSDPDGIFRHPEVKLPPFGPPAAMALANHFLATANGASLGVDLTDDIAFSMAARCGDAAAAQRMVELLKASAEESKAQAEQQADQLPAMLAPLIAINKTLTDSQKIEATGDICKISMAAPDGGKQLGMFIPMIPMMIAPAMQQARFAAQSTQEKNNLKIMSIGLHNFNDVYGRFPKSTSRNEAGDALLSWRVHLLPFVGHEDLYNQFALEEPWDSPANRPLADQMPDIFRSKTDVLDPGHTVYQVPVGPGAAFEDETEIRMRDFTDGTSNTIMIVEVAPDRAVIWTQPADYTFDPEGSLDGLERIGEDGFKAAFVDGHVETLSEVKGDLKPLFTRNGGEVINR